MCAGLEASFFFLSSLGWLWTVGFGFKGLGISGFSFRVSFFCLKWFGVQGVGLGGLEVRGFRLGVQGPKP